MSVPAWQRRASERQQLLDDLMNLYYRKEEVEDQDEVDRTFGFKVLQKALHCLYPDGDYKVPDSSASKFLVNDILPRIKEFSRSGNEERVVLVHFIERVFKTCTGHIHGALQAEEHAHPERIFKAKSATAEVPLRG